MLFSDVLIEIGRWEFWLKKYPGELRGYVHGIMWAAWSKHFSYSFYP
jgi:hypothetical protein